MWLWRCLCVSTSDRPDSHLIYTYPNFYKRSAGLVCSVCIWQVCVCVCVRQSWQPSYLTPRPSMCVWVSILDFLLQLVCTTVSHRTVASLSRVQISRWGLVSEDLLGFKRPPLLLLPPNSVIRFTLAVEQNKNWRRDRESVWAWKRLKATVIKRATNAKPFYSRPMVFSDQIKGTF